MLVGCVYHVHRVHRRAGERGRRLGDERVNTGMGKEGTITAGMGGWVG